MKMDISKTEAASSGHRIIGYDVARALAIFGMFVVNFKLVMTESITASSWVGSVTELLEGRAAVLFIVLAGAGLSLISRRAREKGDPVRLGQIKRTLLRRAALLFVGGLLFVSVWPPDILHFYGLYLTTGAFLLAVPDRRLWLLAGGMVMISLSLILFFDYDAGWHWKSLAYSGFWSPAGMVRHMFFNGFHPYFPWAAFFLAGMWLGRRNMGDKKVRWQLIFGGIALTAIAETSSAGLRYGLPKLVDPGLFTEFEALLGVTPIPPTLFYLGSSVGTALTVIGLCMVLADRFSDTGWFRLAAAVGRHSLTLYIAHIVVGMGVLETFERLEGQPLDFAVGCGMVFFTGSVIFVAVWRRTFSHGPAEYLLRKIAG